jgi:hypothetical protein
LLSRGDHRKGHKVLENEVVVQGGIVKETATAIGSDIDERSGAAGVANMLCMMWASCTGRDGQC